MRLILISLRLIEVARLSVTRMAVVVVDCVINYIYIQFFL